MPPLTIEWETKKKQAHFKEIISRKKKTFQVSSLFLYSCSLLAQAQFTLCHFHHFFFFTPLGEKKRWVGEWIYRKRLQWADISFSRSCHEGTCEMGEASPPPPWWTGVENVVCG